MVRVRVSLRVMVRVKVSIRVMVKIRVRSGSKCGLG